MLDAVLFGDGHLHVVDVAAVPDRLEDAVGEPERQDVLDGLLPEVVIDAVDLRLAQAGGRQLGVERARALEVVAERLLDDRRGASPRPRASGRPRRGAGATGAEQVRRHREVEEIVRRHADAPLRISCELRLQPLRTAPDRRTRRRRSAGAPRCAATSSGSSGSPSAVAHALAHLRAERRRRRSADAPRRGWRTSSGRCPTRRGCRSPAAACGASGRPTRRRSRGRRASARGLDMAAELRAQRREQLLGEGVIAAASGSGRRAPSVSTSAGTVLLDRGLHRPASFARVGDVADELRRAAGPR